MKEDTHIPQESIEPTGTLPEVETPKQNTAAYGIAAVIFLIVIVGIGIGLQKKSTSPQVADTTQNTIPVVQDNQMTTLTIDADAASVSSTMVTVPIRIDTQDNIVSAVELVLSVDPQTVTGLKVTAGSFFVEPTILEDRLGDAPGTYVFIIGSLTPKQGSGDIAQVSWTKKADVTGMVTVRFDPQTQAAAIGESGTVVKDLIDGVVQY